MFIAYHIFSIGLISRYSGTLRKYNSVLSPYFQAVESTSESSAAESERDKSLLPLEFTAPRWRMMCYDADDGIFGLDTQDPALGVEVVKCNISRAGGFGLNFIEYNRPVDRRNMVLIESLTPGGNAEKSARLRPGDTISFVGIEPFNMLRTEGLDLDRTLLSIKEAAPDFEYLTFVVKRLVTRNRLDVLFVNDNGDESEYSLLAGSNLRSEMMKKNIQVYDSKTKRFDQPYITGDCGGEGICGTCLVECVYGLEKLNNKDNVEKMVTKSRPYNWRLSCRTVIGANNENGEIKFRILPQRGKRTNAPK